MAKPEWRREGAVLLKTPEPSRLNASVLMLEADLLKPSVLERLGLACSVLFLKILFNVEGFAER